MVYIWIRTSMHVISNRPLLARQIGMVKLGTSFSSVPLAFTINDPGVFTLVFFSCGYYPFSDGSLASAIIEPFFYILVCPEAPESSPAVVLFKIQGNGALTKSLISAGDRNSDPREKASGFIN